MTARRAAMRKRWPRSAPSPLKWPRTATARPPRVLDAIDARVGDDVAAVGDRAAQRGHRGRLLGLVRAAVKAAARAAAAFLVATDEAPFDAGRPGAASRSSRSVLPAVVALDDRPRRQLLLDARRRGVERGLGQAVGEAEFAMPAREDLGRQAPHDRRVHEGRAADAAPLQNRRRRATERRLLALVAEQPIARRAFGDAELLGAQPRPFLEHHDARARRREHARRRAAAGAGADDDEVGLLERQPAARAVDERARAHDALPLAERRPAAAACRRQSASTSARRRAAACRSPASRRAPPCARSRRDASRGARGWRRAPLPSTPPKVRRRASIHTGASHVSHSDARNASAAYHGEIAHSSA